MVAFLESVGGAAGPAAAGAVDPAPYLGTYRWGDGAADLLEIGSGRFGLTLTPAGAASRPLRPLAEPHTFHPAGAPSVRIRFTLTGGRAAALEVAEPPLRATRVAAAGD